MLAEMYFCYSQNSTLKVTKIKEIFGESLIFRLPGSCPCLQERNFVTIFSFINSSLFDKLFEEIPGQPRQVSDRTDRAVGSEHGSKGRTEGGGQRSW
jgi:hypothetical protein